MKSYNLTPSLTRHRQFCTTGSAIVSHCSRLQHPLNHIHPRTLHQLAHAHHPPPTDESVTAPVNGGGAVVVMCVHVCVIVFVCGEEAACVCIYPCMYVTESNKSLLA